MIDWLNLAANALWISACSIALATLSYASWEASVKKDRFLHRLSRPGYQIALGLAGFLFCLGLAGTSDSLIKILIWGLLAAGCIGLMVLAYIQLRKESRVMK